MTLTCTACGLVFESTGDQRAHYKLEWHRYNLKRKVAGLAGVSETDYERRRDAALMRTQSTKSDEYQARCLNCKKNFLSEKAFEQHRQSKKHWLEVNKRGNCIEQIEINGVLQGEAAEQEDVEGVSVKQTSASKFQARNNGRDKASTEENMDEGEGEEVESKAPKELTIEDVNVLQCMFCTLVSADLESSLLHMQKEHGFFVPDFEYLSDLPGLVKYLACKVKVGKICLFCNGKGKTFKTYQDCQKHMVSKCHCKLLYEEDEDLDEYADYYDFAASYEGFEGEFDAEEDTNEEEDEDAEDEDEQEGGWETDDDEEEAADDMEDDEADDGQEKKRNLPKRRIHIAENGELVLLDGRRAGLRDFQRYYRQNLRPDDEREQVVLNKERLLLTYQEAGVSTSTALAVQRYQDFRSQILLQIKARRKQNPHKKSQNRLATRSHKLNMMSFR